MAVTVTSRRSIGRPASSGSTGVEECGRSCPSNSASSVDISLDIRLDISVDGGLVTTL
ncbi:hypothetical protein ACPA54_30000 [Uniformispora flossi]|uniref:hypothetical protein n=1 Tax=Uniformispora flossi TaxID=3390723 RepID=UPI003C2FD08D